MRFTRLDDVTVHYSLREGDGVPVVFLNSLGTDLRIWDGVIARLDPAIPVLGLDKRGHGLSDEGPVSIDTLAGDVAALMDRLELGPALICGVSVGGMIAQALAVARPDLVAGLVLCCTGAKIGDAETWNTRIETVRRDGIAAMSGAILERWFSGAFRDERAAEFAGYRNMLERTPPEGYAAVSAAIRDADLTEAAARITAPTQCIAGSEDLATPPALVETLAGLIPGAGYEVIDGCGHLPCIEQPARIAEAIRQMLVRLA